jgi:hypothetical protein
MRRHLPGTGNANDGDAQAFQLFLRPDSETAAQLRGTLADSHHALPGFPDPSSATRALL